MGWRLAAPLSQFIIMCLPDYWRNTPLHKAKIPHHRRYRAGRSDQHSECMCQPARPLCNQRWVPHFATQSLQARKNRPNERWSTCLVFDPSGDRFVTSRRSSPDRRKASTYLIFEKKGRTSSTKKSSKNPFAPLFEFAEAISHVSLRPVPTPPPSAAF